ncbi:MAG: peptidase S41, partial [Chitinophagaceae bacterium]|nr:peptidase S41 [Chitinophagaceae bacterium]
MNSKGYLYIILLFLYSCTASRNFVADKKYPISDLKKDYTIFRGALEEGHPGLYWFTPKDSMDKYFDEGFNSLKDSMTERQFRTSLMKVVADIKCGHTAVGFSKRYMRYLDTANLKLFPLAFKVWKDTLAVTGNLNRKDSIFTRGTVVTAINNYSSKFLIDTFFHYLNGDGNSITGKYQTLSTFGTFGVMYKNCL